MAGAGVCIFFCNLLVEEALILHEFIELCSKPSFMKLSFPYCVKQMMMLLIGGDSGRY